MNMCSRLGLLLFAATWPACAAPPGSTDEADYLGVTESALSACNETVPATRFLDGIPSYAQCDATQNSAIYSNNGVDTSLTKVGADWVRTQGAGGYQCTEFAGRYLTFKWGVKWRPNGNAGAWCDTMPPASSGMIQTMTPSHGDVMVLAGGSCGASADTGHVNVVDTVDMAKGKLVAVEQNGARRGTYNISCGKCFLHVVANDGTNPGLPITGAPPGTGAAGAGAAGAAPGGAAGTAAGSGAVLPPSAAGSSAAPPAPPASPGPAGAAAPPPPPASTPLPPIGGKQPPPVVAGSSAPAPVATPSPTPVRGVSSADEAASCSTGRAGGAGSLPTALLLASALALLALRRRRVQATRRTT